MLAEDGELKKKIREWRRDRLGFEEIAGDMEDELFSIIDEAKKAIFSKIPKKEVIDVIVDGDGDECNVYGYSTSKTWALIEELKHWFGDSSNEVAELPSPEWTTP